MVSASLASLEQRRQELQAAKERLEPRSLRERLMGSERTPEAIQAANVPGLKVHVATLVAPDTSPGQEWQEVYVHAKLMLIDDTFMTLGNANINTRSMQTDSEMNIAHHRPETASPCEAADATPGSSTADSRPDAHDTPHMPSNPAPDEMHLSVERGSHLNSAPATDADQRARLCSVAWSLSMLFGGDSVRVQNYLPGLHLDIRALSQPLPGASGHTLQHGTKLVRRPMPDWLCIERTLWAALHGSVECSTVEVHDGDVCCAIRLHGTAPDPQLPLAFTLRCHWPGTLGGLCTATAATE